MNQGVTVVNDVDDVGAPEGYVFLNRVLYGKDVPRPLVDQLPSCECTDCGETATDPTLACMCVERSGGVMMYDQHERLIDLTVREIIQECTEKCACTMMCHNRVVQRGRQVDLEIFRTPNRGWGVRADEDIPAGTFVEVYTGEVLTIKEVMDREDFYDSVCYTFELDMHISYEDDDGDDEPEYVIDAFNMGNVSHFFNHSCEPNMETRAVRWDHHDPAIYNLAFFTIRPVMEGEEMCFDYYPGQERTPPEDKELSPCLCGARTCRKWILL
jgi:histone-lysine N-methyltransferase SUV39H